MMKKIDKDDVKSLINAIKKFNKEVKDEEVAAASSKISTKDLLFYFLTQNQMLETRLTKVETTQKMAYWFIGIALAIISIGIGVFKL